MTPDHDNTIEDTPGELERLELIIDKAALCRAPLPDIADIRVHGDPEAVGRLVVGVARARKNFKPIHKDADGQTGNQKYKYAPMPALVDATEGPLADEGINIFQFLSGPSNTGAYRVTTWLCNDAARIESIVEFTFGKLDSDSLVKAWGGISSYLRRYAFQSVLQLDGDVDPDSRKGNAIEQERRQPPALEGRPAPAPQRRSEPPPKPAQRQQPKAPQNGSQGRAVANGQTVDYDPRPESPRHPLANPTPKGGFAGRLAENRGKPAPEPPPDMPPLWDDEESGFQDPNLVPLPKEQLLPDHGDRPTSPLVEAAKPKDTQGSTVDPKKAEHFLKLAKQLGVTGPKLITWMEKRINKTDPSKVTEKEIDFLIESATEELAAR